MKEIQNVPFKRNFTGKQTAYARVRKQCACACEKIRLVRRHCALLRAQKPHRPACLTVALAFLMLAFCICQNM